MNHALSTAVSRLRMHPFYALTTAALLALAIASNVAVFTVLSRTLFRPLPFEAPSRLVSVQATHIDSAGEARDYQIGTVEFVNWRAKSSTLDAIDVIRVTPGSIRDQGQTGSIKVGMVSGGIFRLLGVRPLIGRDFEPADDQPTPRSVILSHGLWERRFGSDPAALGKTIVIDARPLTIIGVMPPRFEIPRNRADAFVPLGLGLGHMPDRTLRYLNAIARLKATASPAAAQADLSRISAELGKAYPQTHADYGVSVKPLREALYGERRPALLLLFAAVLLVHLLACLNAANLMLVQVADGRAVTAVRLAMGARIAQIVRYRIVEGLVISGSAAVAGLILGTVTVQIILRNYADRDLLAAPPGAGVLIAGFVCALAIVTALVVSVLPALREAKIPVAALLNEGSQRASASLGGRRARELFIVAQIALAIPLLVGAAITVKRFQDLQSFDLRFDPEGVMTAQLIMPSRYENREQRARFVAELVRRLENAPGVLSAAVTTCTFRVGESPGTVVRTESMPEMATLGLRRITPRYFETMRSQLLAGRAFNDQDVLDAPAVAIVSESLAKSFWPGQDPIGKNLIRNAGNTVVVGVAPDIRDSGVAENIGPVMYLPYLQNNGIFVSIVARAQGDPSLLRGTITRAIQAVDADLAPDEVLPLRDLVNDSLGSHRLQVALLGGFGLIALVLAAVGIFAVTSYAVAQRMQEVGIRMAFGASPKAVVSELLRAAGRSVAAGVLVGLLLTVLALRFMPNLRLSFDPGYAALVTAILIASAFVASLIPALRARLAHPATLLRRA
jgi:predicted permease